MRQSSPRQAPQALDDNEILARAAKILEERAHYGDVLTSPQAVKDYMRVHLVPQEREVFSVVWLNAQHAVIEIEDLFVGTLTQTSVYPREVVKSALRHNAAAVIFAHNHPSGVAEPSSADESLTRLLKQALGLVDVGVLDHFIVGDRSILSFAERGLI